MLHRALKSDSFGLIATGVTAVLIVFVLWSPVGWNVTPTNENWRNRAIYEGYTSFRVESKFLFEWQSRPFMLVVPHVAHALTPESSLGFNFVQAAIFAGKAIAAYLLLRKVLRGQTVIPYVGAILFMVYPADGGMMTLRSIVIHGSAFAFTAACWLLLVYWDRPRPWTLLAMFGLLALTFGAYEAAYPVMGLAPLLLIWREGRISRRVVRVSALWYLIPAIFFVNTAASLALDNSKQLRNLEAGTEEVGTFGDLAALVARDTVEIYARNFVTGWTDSVRAAVQNPSYVVYGLLAGAVVFAVAAWQGRAESPPPARLTIIGIVSGIVLIILLTVFYIVTNRISHGWRIYIYSAFGASLTITLIASLIARRLPAQTAVFAAAGALLIGAGVTSNIVQHVAYGVEAKGDQRTFTGILTIAPRLEQPAYLVVVRDYRISGTDDACDANSSLHEGLQLLYNTKPSLLTGVAECHVSRLAEVFGQDSITADDLDPAAQGVPYGRLIVVDGRTSYRLVTDLSEFEGVGAVSGYDPSALIDQEAPLPPRLTTYFAP